MKFPFACTLLIAAVQMTAQVFDNMTMDSISSGLRPVDPKVALDTPIVMSFHPLNEVGSKSLFVGTLYGRNTDIDVTGYDGEMKFGDLGYRVYDVLKVGETATFFEERCYTFQYMDFGGDVGNAVTLCVTTELVDYLLDRGDAYIENGKVIVTRPLRTERGYNTTVHVSWIENEY